MQKNAIDIKLKAKALVQHHQLEMGISVLYVCEESMLAVLLLKKEELQKQHPLREYEIQDCEFLENKLPFYDEV